MVPILACTIPDRVHTIVEIGLGTLIDSNLEAPEISKEQIFRIMQNITITIEGRTGWAITRTETILEEGRAAPTRSIRGARPTKQPEREAACIACT